MTDASIYFTDFTRDFIQAVIVITLVTFAWVFPCMV